MMYSVKPLYDVSQSVVLSDVMYKVTPIQGAASTEYNNSKVSPELMALKEKQDRLLSILDHMINETLSGQKSPLSTSRNSCQEKSESTMDVVVHANPDKPPKCLDFISRLLQEKFQVLRKTHVHSSINHELNPELLISKLSSMNRSKYDIVITVIYSAVVDEPVAIISPSITSPIEGESNIGRLFGRLLNIYDSGPQTLSLTRLADIFLDASDIIASSSSTNNEKQAALKIIDGALQKKQWLCGETPTFVDAVALSAIRNSRISVSLPSVKKWMGKSLDQ